MVVQLIPFDTENKFKNIRKMSMVNSHIQEGGGQLRPLQFPSSHAPVEDKKTFYKNTLVNTAIQSELGKPINEKIISHLSRDIIDILQDHELNDAQKASNYLQAIKRYLIYQGKLNNLTPVGSIEPVEAIFYDEPKLNKIKQDRKHQRKNSVVSSSELPSGSMTTEASPYNSNEEFNWEGYSDKSYDERHFQENKLINSFKADKSGKVKTLINSICDNIPLEKLNWNISKKELIIDEKKFKLEILKI